MKYFGTIIFQLVKVIYAAYLCESFETVAKKVLSTVQQMVDDKTYLNMFREYFITTLLSFKKFVFLTLYYHANFFDYNTDFAIFVSIISRNCQFLIFFSTITLSLPFSLICGIGFSRICLFPGLQKVLFAFVWCQSKKLPPTCEWVIKNNFLPTCECVLHSVITTCI